MQLGILVTRAALMDASWTTVHIAVAALLRRHAVRFIEPHDLEVDDRGRLVARAFGFDPPAATPERIVRALRKRDAPRHYVRVDQLDVLLLRTAPFDAGVAAFATMAQAAGVDVVNDPAAMLRVHHKAWLATLPDVPTPATIVTQSMAQAELFYDKHRKPVVIKPSRGSGGRGVHLVKRRDPVGFDQAFRAARALGGHVVVQTYLPDAEHGEKRLVWMDGEVLGGYLRTRAPGDFRHNLKQGGLAVPTQITPGELSTVARLTPHLQRAGLRLAGLDLIGDQVVEVNAVNPGGSFHADRLHGTDVSGRMVERLLGPSAPRPLTEHTPWPPPEP